MILNLIFSGWTCPKNFSMDLEWHVQKKKLQIYATITKVRNKKKTLWVTLKTHKHFLLNKLFKKSFQQNQSCETFH